MTMLFDRTKFFDNVRETLFAGHMNQQQVDGMNFKIDVWEDHPYTTDLRWLSYCFATSHHETDKKMWPIEEYSKGAGMDYGVPDPVTGQVYYGRGDVQLTWSSNYKLATTELNIQSESDKDLYWHPENALDPAVSADVMYLGMTEGWFTGKKLNDFFNATANDAVNARSIINADVSKNGQLVAGYHAKFFTAFMRAYIPHAPELEVVNIKVYVDAPPNIDVKVEIVKSS